MFQKINVLLIVSLLFTAILVSSCSSGKPPAGNKFTEDNYKMIFKDTMGANLYEGILEVDNYIKNKTGKYTVSGIYYFTKINAKDKEGFSFKEGPFEGFADSAQTKISLNMNPKTADNNLYLNFSINPGLMKGTWSLETLQGTEVKGLLEIKKAD